MKNVLIVISLLCSFQMFAQTKVVKRSALRSNNFGITYSLPNTSIIVNVEVRKNTHKAGPYYNFADRYLGIKDIVTEDKVYYEIGNVHLYTKGVPDKDNTYIVEFRSGTVAPYAYLTEEGLICSINAEYTPEESKMEADIKNRTAPPRATDASVFSEELLMAGSIAKQAEVAARQIYRIRESRMNILTGDADNLPPDGEAMRIVIQHLEEQERALTNLFTGVISTETTYRDFTTIPYGDMEKDVLLRFSSRLGIIDADDLGGAPVYINLTATDLPEVLDDRERARREKAMRRGIIYNIPGKANVEVVMNNKTLHKGEILVAQFGTKEVLASEMFEDRRQPVKVIFYPETGAIRQIIQ